MVEIKAVTPAEFPAFEPLFARYQEFYEVEEIDPERNRLFFGRFVTRSGRSGTADGWLLGAFENGSAVGFACFYRHKSSLTATDIVLMNDLFVTEAARGRGTGRALIDAGADLAREWGASHLTWSTAPDNHRAQALYDSTGAERSTWLEYEITL